MTDIEGSTARWERARSVMREAVRRHDAILIQCIDAHCGKDLLKKGEGDSHVAIFESPALALSAGIAIHRALQSQHWGEIGPLRVRIAIHSGEPELRNNDVFGPDVNRCARMRAAAHGGQTILSETTKRLLGSNLPDGASLKDLGSHRFKDLLEPERIYQLCCEGLEQAFPRLNSLTGRNNLPTQLTSFVGRSHELERVRQMLARHRLVTLDGSGGGGKTRLAIQVGAELLDSFPDGVWFSTLVGVASPSAVPATIASPLPISTKEGEPLAQIREQFSDAQALLIIDNCEDYLEAVANFVEEALRECPKIAILATSRERLAVRGEGTYRIPPLECDLKGRPTTLENVAGLEAVQLLRERCYSRLSGEDILTNSSAATVAGICKKLDGIPLAIEQAAANLAYMSPAELLERLDEQCSLLGIDEVGVPDRHKTMVAALEVSYQGLPEHAKVLFGRLSTFPSGWSLKSAEHVCNDDSISSTDILRSIEKLVDRSLVQSERSEALQAVRFRMLEPIRQFGQTKLEASDREIVNARMFDWYLHLAAQADQAGLEAAGKRYEKLLDFEIENIRASLAWGLSKPTEHSKALEMCIYLHRYWLKRGLYREGGTWVQRAITADECSGELHAEGLNVLGIFSWHRGDLAPAELAFQQSLELWTALGNKLKQAAVLNNLSGLAFMREDYGKVVELLSTASNTFREYGDFEKLATTLENLGVAMSMVKDLESAESHLEEAIRLHRRHTTPEKLAKAIDSLLGIYVMRGTLKDHSDLLLEAINIAETRDLSNPLLDSNLLEVSAKACYAHSSLELSARAWGAMDRLVEENELALPPNQLADRESFTQELKDALGYSKYNSLYRRGRELGSNWVIREIQEFLNDNVD